MQRVVDAGASRIGVILGDAATARDWASLVDHTLLKAEASEADITRLCEEAAQYRFASVCVNPSWVQDRGLRAARVGRPRLHRHRLPAGRNARRT